MSGFDLSRRLVAEALGTAILVATVVGSGIMAETLTKDVALALLGNTAPSSWCSSAFSAPYLGRILIPRFRWCLRCGAS
jgi:glycerol uptake facilitator-like aquaporin